MARYIFNTPILTSYGVFAFYPATVEQAVAFIRAGGWTSAIGHAGTSQLLTQLSGVLVPVNRITAALEVGDQALVFRLLQRQQEGRELTFQDVRGMPHQYGILERLQ